MTARVVGLWRYPVKSMSGERCSAVSLDAGGIVGDRSYALVDALTGKVASAKNPRLWSRLLEFEARYLEPPGRNGHKAPVEIKLPNGARRTTADAALDDELSNRFGRAVRLSALAPAAPQLEEYWPDLDDLAHRDEITEEAMPSHTFFDCASVHVLTTNTLTALSARYPPGDFAVRRFRPNLLVTTDDGGDFPEDAWIGENLRVGAGRGASGYRSDPSLRDDDAHGQDSLPQDLVKVLRTAALAPLRARGCLCRGGQWWCDCHRRRTPTNIVGPIVARLRIYPFKSLDGVDVAAASIVARGALRYDRAFALVDDDGAFVNGKREPRVHELRVVYDDTLAHATFTSPRLAEPFHFALDADPTPLAAWLGRHFERRIALRFDLSGGFPDDERAPGPTIVSSATLATVASWLPALDAASMRDRLRANIEVDGVPAFWEDGLYGAEGIPVPLRIGEVVFEGSNPCARLRRPEPRPANRRCHFHVREGRRRATRRDSPGLGRTLTLQPLLPFGREHAGGHRSDRPNDACRRQSRTSGFYPGITPARKTKHRRATDGFGGIDCTCRRHRRKSQAVTSAMLILSLCIAACLEVGGDAIVRVGLKSHSGPVQILVMALGGCVLFGYGVFVNLAPFDFGKLLGAYVALFFVAAQIANLVAFGIYPSVSVVIGGALILAGGTVITFGK